MSIWNAIGEGWKGNKVLFLCGVCVDTVYLSCFQGVALLLVVISVLFHGVLTRCGVLQMWVLIAGATGCDWPERVLFPQPQP